VATGWRRAAHGARRRLVERWGLWTLVRYAAVLMTTPCQALHGICRRPRLRALACKDRRGPCCPQTRPTFIQRVTPGRHHPISFTCIACRVRSLRCYRHSTELDSVLPLPPPLAAVRDGVRNQQQAAPAEH
jgi:hypothetical protein